MKITIETIPHAQQRYKTVGDWEFDSDGNLSIKVSKLSSWRLEALVALHELVEVILCKHHGIPQALVDDFDIEFEKNRQPGDNSEPGDDPHAPYRCEHCSATGFERILAAQLDVNWADYGEEVDAL